MMVNEMIFHFWPKIIRLSLILWSPSASGTCLFMNACLKGTSLTPYSNLHNFLPSINSIIS
jgi:hypothetical protein